MAKLDRVLVYACIDTLESAVIPPTRERQMEVVRQTAQMVRDAGVDIVEAGTPIIYSLGYKSIRAVREVMGPDFPVVADFKAQDGCGFYFRSAKAYGADYGTVTVVHNDGGLKAALLAKEECGIKVIADLFGVPVSEMGKRAKECEEMGADAILIHFGYDENTLGIYPGRRDCDGVKEVAEAVSLPVAVVANQLEDVEQAIKDGADCILFGLDLLGEIDHNTFIRCRDFVDAVHELDRKYNHR